MSKLHQLFSNTRNQVISLVVITIAFYPIAKYVLCLTDPKDIIEAYVILSALISGLAFIGFLHATRLQREQLQLQTDEIKLQRQDLEVQQRLLAETVAESKEQNRTIALQRFENTFFRLIGSLNDGLEYIYFSDVGNDVGGRQAFKKVYDNQKQHWEAHSASILKLGPSIKQTDYKDFEEYRDSRNIIYKEFSKQLKRDFYDYNQTYFETILTCVELIKRNREILESEFDEYHRVLLAHLSIYEKWELFIYVDAFDHPLRSHLRGINFFRDLTDKNFEDPHVFHAFKHI